MSTAVDCRENAEKQLIARTMEQWEDQNAPITADLCDIHGAM